MFTKIIRVLNNLIERFTPRQLLAGAAIIGALVVLMVYFTLTQMESSLKAAQPKEIKLTKIVVAKVDIPRGVVIQKDMLRVKEFVVDSLPKGTSSQIEMFLNLPTKLEIFAGDILTTDKVFTDYRQAGFIGMIPDDCRAVTIPANNVTAISGLIKAGDHVDIILIRNVEGGTKSSVFMENVLLLSINQNVDRQIQNPKPKDKKGADQKNSEDKKSKPEENSTTENLEEVMTAEEIMAQSDKLAKQPMGQNVGMVTLALKPDEITRVIAATTMGRFYLALRPLKPRSDSMYIHETDYYSATDSSEPPPPKSTQPATPPVPVIPVAPVPNAQVPSPNLPVIPNNGKLPTKQDDAFEIIQWGN